ncbi:Kinesin like protein, partial [Aduncisulcus paluster]
MGDSIFHLQNSSDRYIEEEVLRERGFSSELEDDDQAKDIYDDQDSRIKVAVRIRPVVDEDFAGGEEQAQECVLAIDPNTVGVDHESYGSRDFSYDLVLSPSVAQCDVFEKIGRPLVEDVLRGFNSTVLAYGQTATGKTYTVFGPQREVLAALPKSTMLSGGQYGVDDLPDQAGLIPRCVVHLFDRIQAVKSSFEFQVTVSYLQIYQEQLIDLMRDPGTSAKEIPLSIREDPKNGIYVDNLTQVPARTPRDVLAAVAKAASKRVFASTSMNSQSSRSHVVLNITVEQRIRGEVVGRKTGTDGSVAAKRGVLTIVDLAGSERVSKTHSRGQRLQEAQHINKSLMMLGSCVSALSSGKKGVHIPFRDSTLTRLLTDSLGGNSKTCIIATLGPCLYNYSETVSTLRFATRCMCVHTHARVNEIADFRSLNKTLQQQLVDASLHCEVLQQRNTLLLSEVENLRARLRGMSVSQPGMTDDPMGSIHSLGEQASTPLPAPHPSSSSSSSSSSFSGAPISDPSGKFENDRLRIVIARLEAELARQVRGRQRQAERYKKLVEVCVSVGGVYESMCKIVEAGEEEREKEVEECQTQKKKEEQSMRAKMEELRIQRERATKT